MTNFFESWSSSGGWHGGGGGDDGFNLNNLNVDEAYLNLTSVLNNTVRVYSLSSDCVQCPFSYVTSLNRTSQTIPISTKHYSVWRFYDETLDSGNDGLYKAVDDKKNLLGEISKDFGEFGIYDVIVDEKNCQFSVRKEPVNIYLTLVVFVIGLVLLYLCVSKLATKFRLMETVVREPAAASGTATANSKRTRTQSIDTFRGLALCLMIFVNDGGGQYWFFNHCTWDGLYLADLLFPWFLWIVGLCIPLSQRTLAKNSYSVFVPAKNIIRRSVTLFVFGLSLNTLGVGPVDLSHIRLPGVLQRIAICYAVVSLISLLPWTLQVELRSSSIRNYLASFVPQWLIYLGILYVHYYLTFHLSVPACPRGYLGPGGMQNDNLYANCTGGATGYLDRLLLGENHLYQHAAVRRVYRAPVPFDPENILGCLTSIFQTFLGTLAGFILCGSSRRTSSPTGKIRHLLICSVVTLSSGLILHYSNAIPLNKNLWSLSFVLTTSGLAFFVFAALYYAIDHARLWNGAPFIYPGMNSVLVYVGHEICFQLFPWHWKIGPMNTHLAHLVESTWGVILWIVITRKLFEKRIFLNV